MGEIRRGMREYLAIGVFYVLCVAARAIEIAIDAFGFARRARSIVRRSIARSIDRSMARRARSMARDLARARAAYLHTHISTMSALLASSFVGRVAAFKATKIQVRIF